MNRVLVVLTEGWIFVGDVQDMGEVCVLHRAVHAIRSAEGGLASLVASPKGANVRVVGQVEYPKCSEIFRIPVSESWGL